MTRERKTADLTFEEAYQRLETIVKALDEGDLKLDELEQKFEEGMQMAAHCTRRLEQIERTNYEENLLSLLGPFL